MRKTLSIVLALVMVLSLIPMTALAAGVEDYDDITADDKYAESAIDRWTKEGVIEGGGNRNFDPKSPLQRDHVMEIYAKLLKLEDKASDEKLAEFKDIDPDEWYMEALSKNVAALIFEGQGNGIMGPLENSLRRDFFVSVGRVLGVPEAEKITNDVTFSDYDETPGWAKNMINALVNYGVVKGAEDGKLYPNGIIRRRDAVLVLDRLIGEYITENTTDGRVTETEGKFTLVVAKNVTLKGKYNGMPIVLYGKGGTVRMSGVTGSGIEVNVKAANITVTGARAGTVFHVGKNATGLRVNGVAVPAGTDYEVPSSSGGYIPPTEPEKHTINYNVGTLNGTTVPAVLVKNNPQTIENTNIFKVQKLENAEGSKKFQDNVYTEGQNKYLFTGWTDEAGNTYVPDVDYEVTAETLTLTANWLDQTDLIAMAVEAAMKEFNEDFKNLENFDKTSTNGYSIKLNPLAFNAQITDNARKQTVNAKASITTNLTNNLIQAASFTAIEMLGTGEEASNEKNLTEFISDVVDEIATELGVKTEEVDGIKNTLREMFKSAKTTASGILGKSFKNNTEHSDMFIVSEITISAGNSGDIKLSVDEATGLTLKDSTRRQAAKKLGVAVAKELYASLKEAEANQTDYDFAPVLTSTVKVKFTPDSTNYTNSGKHPTDYPVTINLTLDNANDQIVGVKYDGTNLHVKFNADKVEAEYNKDATEVIEGVLLKLSANLKESIKTQVEGKDNTLAGLVTVLTSAKVSVNTTDGQAHQAQYKAEAQKDIQEKLDSWLDSYLGTEEETGDILTGEKDNTAIVELMKTVAEAVGKSAVVQYNSAISANGASEHVVALGKSYVFVPTEEEFTLGQSQLVVEEDLARYVSDDLLSGVPEGLQDYFYAVIADALNEDHKTFIEQYGRTFEEYEIKEKFTNALTTGVDAFVEEYKNTALGTSKGETPITETLKNLTDLKATASTKFGDLKDLITNENVKDVVTGEGSSVVGTENRLKSALTRLLNRVPEGATVTFKFSDTESYVVTKDKLEEFESSITTALEKYIKTDAEKNFTLDKFDVEDGVEVDVHYNNTDETFYLWVDGLGKTND